MRAAGSPRPGHGGAGRGGGAGGAASAEGRGRGGTPRKRNAFIAAALREKTKGDDQNDDFSDLEDFLVCKPGRDYSEFFQRVEKKRRRRSKA